MPLSQLCHCMGDDDFTDDDMMDADGEAMTTIKVVSWTRSLGPTTHAAIAVVAARKRILHCGSKLMHAEPLSSGDRSSSAKGCWKGRGASHRMRCVLLWC